MKTKVMFVLTVAILSGCKDVLEMVSIEERLLILSDDRITADDVKAYVL